MKIKKVYIAALFTFLLVGCGGGGAERKNDPVEVDEGTVSDALKEAIERSVLVAVERFVLQANQFNLQADQFCQVKDEDNLRALQEKWQLLFLQWYRLANYNFGPLNDNPVFPRYTFIDSLRLRGTNYLGAVRTEISADIAGNHVLNEDYFAGKTFQKVGLLLLESAVFETASGEHSKALSDIVTEYQNESRKCVLLKETSQQLLLKAQAVESGWLSDFNDSGASYKTIFLTGRLDDGAAPLTVLISSVQGYLDYFQQRSVVTVAASLADISWQAIAAAIDEVETLLEGTSKTEISFIGLMELNGAQVAVDSVRATIDEVRDAIAQQDVDMLDIALGKLDGHFKREIPDSLEIELGINFSDGD